MSKIIDYTEMKFENFTVINRAENVNGKVNWNCQCNCGAKFIASSLNITSRKGCKSCAYSGPKINNRKPRSIISKMYPEKDPTSNGTKAGRYLLTIKSNAKQEGRQIFLSDFQIIDLIKSPCNYCGNTVNFPQERNGIDRADNSIGYIISNCVSCCKYCNYGKRNMSILDFKRWITRLFYNSKGRI